MNIFNIVHNRLDNENFIPRKSIDLEQFDLVMYQKLHLTVFVKQLDSPSEFKNVNSVSRHIKKMSYREDINIYNTYLIFTYDNEISYEDFYELERNSVILRKYVVRNVDDLNRITFLEQEIIKKEHPNDKVDDSKIVDETNELSLSLIELIKKNDGSHRELKTSIVEQLSEDFMEEVVKNEA